MWLLTGWAVAVAAAVLAAGVARWRDRRTLGRASARHPARRAAARRITDAGDPRLLVEVPRLLIADRDAGTGGSPVR